jgi:hypothetical protein
MVEADRVIAGSRCGVGNLMPAGSGRKVRASEDTAMGNAHRSKDQG